MGALSAVVSRARDRLDDRQRLDSTPDDDD